VGGIVPGTAGHPGVTPARAATTRCCRSVRRWCRRRARRRP
jgi:hypothetical protein